MKAITKIEFLQYVAYKKDLSYRNDKAEELKKLSHTIQDTIAKDKGVYTYHLTEGVFKELYIDCLMKLQPNYIIDKYSDEIINSISRYNVLGKKDGKGFLIMGSVGCGKTLLMKGLCQTWRLFDYYDNQIGQKSFGFDIVPTYSLSQGYSKDGYAIFDKGIFQNGNMVNFLNGTLCIDDLGAEDIPCHFGSVVNVVGNVLQQRYDSKSLTFSTTNLDTEHLKTFYGERVYSRMKEMFTFIKMQGNDRR